MKITMMGHATLIIEIDGKTILTDPWLVDPLYFGRLRHAGTYKTIEKLPALDLILVSHGHDDHFDPATLAMIPETVPIVICDAYYKKARKTGFKKVYPLRKGDVFSLDNLRIKTLPGKHIGGIATFLIEGKNEKVFFGGDSEYTRELESVLSEENPDILLLPVSGGGIGFFKFHMNAKEAARLANSSKAKLVIPIHYHFKLNLPFGTRFLMKDDCLQSFKDEMALICPRTKVITLGYNEKITT